MEFTKSHGTGNDFVVLDDRADTLDLAPALVRALCDRRHGLGADGVLRITAGGPGEDVTMDYRNRDGTAVEMCGNGLRVVAKYVLDRGLRPADPDGLVVGTPAGPRRVRVDKDGQGKVVAATVDMGRPDLRPASVPFDVPGQRAVQVPVEAGGHQMTLTALSMGNPHAVVGVDDVAAAPVTEVGPLLEADERFPRGVNVSFAQVVTEREVRLRVWERGVGETASCGSAACATLVAMQEWGRVGDSADVRVPGGVLRVARRGDGAVMLTGAAVEVASGRLDPAWLEAVGSGDTDARAAAVAAS